MGDGFMVYITGDFTYTDHVPLLSTYGFVLGYVALAILSYVNWYGSRRIGVVSLVALVLWVVSSAELAREIDKSMLPGPALWLGWASVVCGTWGVALRRKQDGSV